MHWFASQMSTAAGLDGGHAPVAGYVVCPGWEWIQNPVTGTISTGSQGLC